MPPKFQPRTFILPVKTHKLTFFITTHPTTSFSELKFEALSALTSPVLSSSQPPEIPMMEIDDSDWSLPQVESLEDFEFCKAVKDKITGKLSSEFVTLDGNALAKGTVVNWETLFIQFRDKKTGKLQPVKVSLPSLLEDDEDEQVQPPQPQPDPDPEEEPMSAVRKGKRKARAESPVSDF